MERKGGEVSLNQSTDFDYKRVETGQRLIRVFSQL